MGNRSRYVALVGAVGGMAGWRAARKARRHTKLQHSAEGIASALMPSVAAEMPSSTPAIGIDEAHAPGHRHLRLPLDVGREPARPPSRQAWFMAKRSGLRHPGTR